jgi:hypothetical protein
MIITYYVHSKNIHNLKVMEFEIEKNWKYILKSQNFKSFIRHVNGV